jgi:peroxiredoxin
MVLAEKGIDEIIVFCVNDAAVMAAWAASQGIDKSGIITFMADTNGSLTKALGMEMTHPGPCAVLGAGRCKR